MSINKLEKQDRSKGNREQRQLLDPSENNSVYACVIEQVPGKESNPYGSTQPRLDAGDGKASFWRWGARQIWLEHDNFIFTLISSMH